jgi:hypothetical protein
MQLAPIDIEAIPFRILLDIKEILFPFIADNLRS